MNKIMHLEILLGFLPVPDVHIYLQQTVSSRSA